MTRFSSTKILFLFTVSIAIGALYWLWQPRTPSMEVVELKGDVSRGAYLARMSGCITCHTDTEAGSLPLAGGKRIATPFGEFRAPNLTTDKEYGIGGWTIQQFSAAVREGISPKGKPYYPVFPYTFYRQFSDQDMADLWSAFQTVSAISEPDPKQDIAFPFNIREGLNLWQALFFDARPIESRPIESGPIESGPEKPKPIEHDSSEMGKYERGKYIVEVAAHCGACHTPRNIFGARKLAEALTGGVDGENNPVPSISTEVLRANKWTEDDLAYALQTAIKTDGDVFGGSMSDVVEHGTAYLAWEDLQSIAHYLLNRKE